MNLKNIEALLDCYLNGEISVAEKQLVEEWLDTHNSADSFWENIDKASQERLLLEHLGQIQTTLGFNRAKNPILTWNFSVKKIAAAAAVFFFLAGLYISRSVLEQNLFSPGLITIRVPTLKHRQITFCDGTKVWLNAGAELKYPEKFKDRKREVYLSGEAYFDVHHDAARPFLIHTGKVLTTVLGTAFNVREDKDLHIIEVTVTRGKVSVEEGSKLLGIVLSDQQIRLDLRSRKFVQQRVSVKEVTAWKNTELLFNDLTFEEAIVQIRSHFGVKISFANETLKNCRFSGTPMNGDKLDKILKVICAFNNATYKTNPDGSIIIDGPGCNQ